MQPLDAIRKMLDDSHTTPYAAGIATGYSHTYVSNLFNRGTIPGVDRMATIANACNYQEERTSLFGRGEAGWSECCSANVPRVKPTNRVIEGANLMLCLSLLVIDQKWYTQKTFSLL